MGQGGLQGGGEGVQVQPPDMQTSSHSALALCTSVKVSHTCIKKKTNRKFSWRDWEPGGRLVRGQMKANLAIVGLGYMEVVCLGEGTISGAGGGQQLSGRGGREPVEPGQQLRMPLQEIVLRQKRVWGQTGTWGPYVCKDWMLGGGRGRVDLRQTDTWWVRGGKGRDSETASWSLPGNHHRGQKHVPVYS